MAAQTLLNGNYFSKKKLFTTFSGLVELFAKIIAVI